MKSKPKLSIGEIIGILLHPPWLWLGGLISFQDLVAGLAIGAASKLWFDVLISSVGWGIVSWLFVVLIAGRASYKPGTKLIFGSPRLTRFIVWSLSGFVTSLIVGGLIYAGRTILASS
jgi:hypothetical protein